MQCNLILCGAVGYCESTVIEGNAVVITLRIGIEREGKAVFAGAGKRLDTGCGVGSALSIGKSVSGYRDLVVLQRLAVIFLAGSCRGQNNGSLGNRNLTVLDRYSKLCGDIVLCIVTDNRCTRYGDRVMPCICALTGCGQSRDSIGFAADREGQSLEAADRLFGTIVGKFTRVCLNFDGIERGAVMYCQLTLNFVNLIVIEISACLGGIGKGVRYGSNEGLRTGNVSVDTLTCDKAILSADSHGVVVERLSVINLLGSRRG